MQETDVCSGVDWATMIVAQTSDAIIATDRGGVIRVWNAGAERLFGHRQSEMLGGSLDVIIPETLRKAHWIGFDRAVVSGQMKYSGEVMTTRSMHKDGRKLYIDMSFNLLRDASDQVVGVLAIARDCTARYEAERAMRTRLRELEAPKA
ncbi:PAS sensor domain-containing protein [Imbroritus primus]|uniref:PAS sensor domain-containing protein n=1 Tax=Imbroritus primus TaxID=3058603 RepID=A0ACD3SQG0_9BURK|nr:PAS sensor domain-containing protein [Burkholderiaceae bacterium PBA]